MMRSKMYTIEEYDKEKSKVLKYILYKKRSKQEIKNKFYNTIENEMLDNIIEELEEKPITNFSNEDKLNIMLEHINLELEEKGSYIGIREMRKHLCWYLKNLKNSSAVRQEINQIENVDKLVQVLKAYFSSL